MFPHDPAHSVQANRHPVAGQIPMDLPAACSFPMLQKNGQYLLVQKLSPLPARRHHTPEPRIKSRPGNIKHKALKADEFPFITVDLLNALPQHNEKEMQPGKVYNYNVNTIISIAGISKSQLIHVKMLRTKDNLYRLTASKDILMSEYEIRPRTPFNIIKIDDLISIHFEMLVNAGK